MRPTLATAAAFLKLLCETSFCSAATGAARRWAPTAEAMAVRRLGIARRGVGGVHRRAHETVTKLNTRSKFKRVYLPHDAVESIRA